MSVGAGVASAEYRQSYPTIELSPASVAPGGTFVVTVRTTCVDGASIDIEIQPLGDASVAICNIDSYVVRLTGPSRPGSYDVEADGLDVFFKTTLTVTAALGGPDQPLPRTGQDDALPIAVIGGVLLVAGVALLGLRRVRHRPIG